MVENGFVVDTRIWQVNIDLDTVEGFCGALRVRVQDGNQVTIANDLNVLHPFSGGGVHAQLFRTMGGRPQNSGVDHSRKTDVGRELCPAGNLVDSIHTRCAGV